MTRQIHFQSIANFSRVIKYIVALCLAGCGMRGDTHFIGRMRDKNTSVGAGFAHFER